jgi:hypothetical protein
VIYLLPAVVAQVKRHYQTTAIIGLNLLLGRTFIGRAVALVWALTATPPTVPAATNADPPWLDAARGWALILAGLLVLGLLMMRGMKTMVRPERRSWHAERDARCLSLRHGVTRQRETAVSL